MTPVADIANGLFEFFGGLVVWLNVRRLVRDRGYAGVNWMVAAFFSCWGFWNLYYYPSLGQWWSFAGGLAIVSANTVWLVMALRYGPLVKAGPNPIMQKESAQ